MILLIIYLIGSWLSLFRWYASGHDTPQSLDKTQILISFILSYIFLIIGIVLYFSEDEKYFFKLTNYKNEKNNNNFGLDDDWDDWL